MNARAVVLKEIPLKEEDKIVVVFSKEYGKISLYGKEARKTKSPFLAGTQLLTYSDFYIHKKDNLSSIKRIDIIDSYFDIKNDISKCYLAMYLAELVDNFTIEENPDNELFKFFIFSLETLKKAKNLKLFRLVFELKLLAISGYMPNVSYCLCCGKPVKNGYFNASEEGILCDACNIKKNGNKLSETSVYAIKYALCIELDKLYKFNIDNEYIIELEKMLKEYRLQILGKELKTEKFLIEN